MSTDALLPLRPLAPRYDQGGLSAMSALEQARLVAEGAVSSQELVEHYLGRIARHDGELGAFVEVLGESARREAERADRLRRQGQPLGPFHGVPTAVKDHHMVRRTRTRLGSRAFDWLWSPVDDPTVRRLRQAGFVILGKTSMSELGILPMVEPQWGAPPTRNPWDLGRTAGGSSGGAGSALGAGLVAIAPGSDGAGSVRIPASLNGLFGLKPTRGVVRDSSERIDPYGLTAIGPMGRSLDDVAAMLDVLSGTPGVYGRHAKPRGERLRVGVVLEPPFGEVHPAILGRIQEAVQRLRDAGHHVEERPSPEGTLEEFTPLYQRFVSRIPVVQPSRLGDLARWFWETGRKVSDADAMGRFLKFAAIGMDAMSGMDVMLTPTVGVPAPEVHAWSGLAPAEYFGKAASLGMFTAMANITGQPGLSVPFGEVEGLPVGVQLLGRRGDDALLLRLARDLEDRAG